MSRTPTDSTEALLKAYEETGKLLYVFFDWRYKVMNRFFLAIAGVFVAAQWMLSSPDLARHVYVPLFLGGTLSIVLALMDRVNQRIIFNCYRSGLVIEKKLFSSTLLYGHWEKDFLLPKTRRVMSYRVILQVMYWGSGITLLGASFLAWYQG